MLSSKYPVSISHSSQLSKGQTHQAKDMAVPILRSDGQINISSDATHAATHHRKNIFRSCALKWSRKAGSFLCVFASTASLFLLVSPRWRSSRHARRALLSAPRMLRRVGHGQDCNEVPSSLAPAVHYFVSAMRGLGYADRGRISRALYSFG